MLSPSLSLTFSKLLSIILPRCATLERPVRRRFGKRFTLLCRLGERRFVLPRATVARPICLRDVSTGAIVRGGSVLATSQKTHAG